MKYKRYRNKLWVFNNGTDRFEYITKPTARKRFNEGREIYILPSKVSPLYLNPKRIGNLKPYIEPYIIKWREDEGDNQFNVLVEMFERHKCNSELGYYARYYIKQQ